MFETAGALAVVQPVVALVALVVLPLVWALVAGAVSRDRGTNGDAAPSSKSDVVAVIVALSCAVATLGIALVLATRLAGLPRGHLLVQHVSQLCRLGQLDLGFDLVLDPRSATFAIVIGLIACASTLNTAWSSRPGAGARLAWTGLVTAGALLFCLGDGFAPILSGLGLLSLGGWGLSRGGDPTPNAVGLGGNVAILLGLLFLFWSLGGGFGPEGYDPDGAPRFVLVSTGASSPDPQKATLSMTTHAGALVSADDSDLPGEPVAAPFSILVDPGIATLRVQGGAASADVVVPRVALAAGRAHVLAPYGPTASLRALDDQIAVPRLAPAGGVATVRSALIGRTIAGVRALVVVLLLVLGGGLAHVHSLASRRGHAPIAVVFEAIPAPYLALRFAPLIDPSALDGALVTVIGVASALVMSTRAACVDDGHKALRGVLGAAASISVAAVGLGDSSAGLVVACSVIVATSAAFAAIDARRDVRWLGVACAAAVGLLPGAGASSGYVLAVTAALGPVGHFGSAPFGWAIALAILLTVLFSALAAFRVYDAIIHASVREPGTSRGQGAVVVLLAVIALVGGTTLGAGTSAFGGSVVPLARRLAGPAAIVAARALTSAALALVLSIFGAAVGILLARRVSVATRPPAWLLALGRPYAGLARLADGIGQVATFLQQSVRAMDRDVIEDIPVAVRDLGRKLVGTLGRGSRPADRRPALPDPPDPPRDRLRTIVLLAMVALLGAVVLSSLFLG